MDSTSWLQSRCQLKSKCGGVRSTIRLSGRVVLARHAAGIPSHNLIWNTSSPRFGAVERSPDYVQFINAGGIGANQATSERPRVAIMSVALIVLQERCSLRPLVTAQNNPKNSLNIGDSFNQFKSRFFRCALTGIRRSGLSRPRTVSAGLTPMWELSELFSGGNCGAAAIRD